MWKIANEETELKKERNMNDVRKLRHLHRIQNLKMLQIDNLNAMDSSQRIIMSAIANSNNFSFQEKQQIAKDAVLTPKGGTVKVNDKEIPVEDLQFILANSIELINSETGSANEYYRWIEDGHGIIRKMNDGFVEEYELKERNDFLDSLGQRETELMVCLGLYSNSNTPDAKAKYAELYNKLQKLREIKSAIQVTTKDKADKKIEQKTTQEEYKKALEYWVNFNEIQRAMDEKDTKKQEAAWKKLINRLQKENAGLLSIGALAAGKNVYSPNEKFNKEIADYWRGMQEEALHGTSKTPSEYLILSRNDKRSNRDIAEHIKKLSGIKSIDQQLAERAEYREKQREILGRIKANGFDRERFMRLYDREH